MTTKVLKTSQLDTATYGQFSRSGVKVDVRGFLSSDSGQALIRKIHGAAGKVINKQVQVAPKKVG